MSDDLNKQEDGEIEDSEEGTEAEGFNPRAAYFDKLASLLIVQANGQRGLLIFQAKPKLSAEDEKLLRGFLNSLQIGFDEFKEKLRVQGVSITDFTAELKDTMLAIKVPSLKYYGAFIRHLVNKSLLPHFAVEQQKKAVGSEPEPEQTSSFRPTPFSTRPQPKGKPRT